MFRDSIKRRIAILLKLDADEFNARASEIQQRWERLRSFFGSMFKYLSIGFAAVTTAVGLFMRSVVREGVRAQSVLRALEFSAKAHGMVWDQVRKPLVGFSEAMQKATGYADDLIQQGLKRFIDVGANAKQAISAITTTLDFATGTTMDMETAINLMSKAFAGNTAGLARYLPGLKEVSDGTASFADVQKLVAQFWGDQAKDRLNTFIGRLDLLTNTFGDLKETIFNFLDSGGAFKGLLQYLTNFILGMTRAFEHGKLANASFNMAEAMRIGEQYGRKLIDMMIKFWEWLRTNGPQIWRTVKEAAELAWNAFAKIVEFVGNNPNLVKTAAIVLIFTKVYQIVRDIVGLMAASGMAKLLGTGAWQLFGRAAVPSAAGMWAFSHTGLGTAGVMTVATITGVVIAALAAAGVVAATIVLTNKLQAGMEKNQRSFAALDYASSHAGAPLMRGGVVSAAGFTYPAHGSTKYSSEYYDPSAMMTSHTSGGGGIGGTAAKPRWEDFVKGFDFDKVMQEYLYKGTRFDKEYMDKLKEHLANVRQLRLDSLTQLADIRNQAESAEFERSIAGLDQYAQGKARIEQNLQTQINDIIRSGMNFRDKLAAIEYANRIAMANKELLDWQKRQEKKQKLEQFFMSVSDKVEANYVGRRVSLLKALAATEIQLIGDIFNEWITAQQKKWAIAAAEAVITGQWAKAAAYSQLFVMAGAAKALINEGVRSITDKMLNSNDTPAEQVLQARNTESTSNGRSVGGYTVRGNANYYISPTVIIDGETVIIGDTGLEEAAKTIGTIAVEAVKQGLETGEINLGAA